MSRILYRPEGGWGSAPSPSGSTKATNVFTEIVLTLAVGSCLLPFFIIKGYYKVWVKLHKGE